MSAAHNAAPTSDDRRQYKVSACNMCGMPERQSRGVPVLVNMKNMEATGIISSNVATRPNLDTWSVTNSECAVGAHS